MRVRLPSRRPIWPLGPNGSGHKPFTLAKSGSSPAGALEASRKAALRRYHFDYSKWHDGLSPSASNFKIKYAFLVEFGRHAVLRGQFAFASTGSSPVGRTKYMPYVQAGEEAILKTVGRKRLVGSNPTIPTIVLFLWGPISVGRANAVCVMSQVRILRTSPNCRLTQRLECVTYNRVTKVRLFRRQPNADLAQLVVQLTCNQQVTGSIPVVGTSLDFQGSISVTRIQAMGKISRVAEER